MEVTVGKEEGLLSLLTLWQWHERRDSLRCAHLRLRESQSRGTFLEEVEGLEEFAGVPKDLGLGSSGISHLGWMQFCGVEISLEREEWGCLHFWR